MKVYNFSAGPAVIPADVLNEIHENIISFNKANASNSDWAMEWNTR